MFGIIVLGVDATDGGIGKIELFNGEADLMAAPV